MRRRTRRALTISVLAALVVGAATALTGLAPRLERRLSLNLQLIRLTGSLLSAGNQPDPFYADDSEGWVSSSVIEAADRVVRVLSSSVPSARTHWALGKAHILRGDYEAAAAELEQAMLRDARDAVSLAQLTTLVPHLSVAVRTEAIKALNRSAPSTLAHLVLLADQYRMRDQWERVVAILEVARQINSADTKHRSLALRQLGEGYVRHLGRPQDAVPVLTEAVALAPRDGFAHALLGEALVAQGELQRGISELEEAVQLDASPYARYQLAQAYLRARQWPAAVEAFGAALEADPTSFWSHYGKGRAHLGGGEPKSALAEFSIALTIDSSSPYGYYGAGLAYCELGQSKQAVCSFQMAIALDSAFALAQTALRYAQEAPCQPGFVRLVESEG